MGSAAAIKELHDRCAVYTSAPTAARLLDIVGWTVEEDLSTKVLLEPCVGEGSILLEAVRRLVASMRRHGHALLKSALLPRIKGFELHPATGRSARIAARRLLLDEGLSWNTASDLAQRWIVERDFLLTRPGRVSHVAANPPYVRWGKLPASLAAEYRDALPASVTRGDVSVAFLHRMKEWAGHGGKIVALVSDRWMYAQYGQDFVAETNADEWSIRVADERPDNPFVKTVGAYSAIVVFERTTGTEAARATTRERARHQLCLLVEKHGNLLDAGCVIRVGPALGAGQTFVVEKGALPDVEEELIRPFCKKSDLGGGDLHEVATRVIVPYDCAGNLIDLDAWPRFGRWAEQHREALAARSQFRECGRYWRTIDAIPAVWTETPKLLIPELCKKPLATIDHAGSIPAHSIYAIWTTEWPIHILQRVLNAGLLELTAVAEAPSLKSGWKRFYKRFLARTPLPKWSALSELERAALGADDAKFAQEFKRLFGFPPGMPPVS